MNEVDGMKPEGYSKDWLMHTIGMPRFFLATQWESRGNHFGNHENP